MKNSYQNLILCFAIYFALFATHLYAQTDKNSTVKQKVAANKKLFQTNMDKAFLQINNIYEEAVAVKDSTSQLVLFDRMCRYYYSKNDVNKLMAYASQLEVKAYDYNNANFEAMACVYMAEAYSINQLPDKALQQLNKAIAILDKSTATTDDLFYTRANILLSQANIYSDKGEYKEAVKKLQIVNNSRPKDTISQSYRKFQYVNYSNLAGAYVFFNVDSAENYARKSISLKPNTIDSDNILALNYYVLGEVALHKKNIDEALENYLVAEKISDKTGDLLNADNLYSSIIKIYLAKGDTASAKKYQYKLKDNEITTLKSKYNSLHKVLTTTPAQEQNNTVTFKWILGGIALVFIIVAGILFIKKRRQKQMPLTEEEHDSNTNLEYDVLLDMIKRDDSAFIFIFEKNFPHFSKRLLDINPQLVQSEIEFCAMLKMKLSTKKIAQLTYIETRTVQNKKHRMRKRLNIPADVDIYTWFDSL